MGKLTKTDFADFLRFWWDADEDWHDEDEDPDQFIAQVIEKNSWESEGFELQSGNIIVATTVIFTETYDQLAEYLREKQWTMEIHGMADEHFYLEIQKRPLKARKLRGEKKP